MSDDDITVLFMAGEKYSENPYTRLLSDALEGESVDVRTPEYPLFFPLVRTVLRNRDADVMQLEWVYDYYIVSATGYESIDTSISIARAVTFILDLLIASLLPVAIVRTVHNVQHHEGKFRRTERVVNEVLFFIADAVTVKCSAAREIVASAYRVPRSDRMAIVPDGNYTEAYEDQVSKADARDELSIDEDTFVYLYFGLIREYKGVPDLIEAFVDADVPDAELWIVGNPHTDAIERTIRAFATGNDDLEAVLEFVPEERIQYYMNAADVLVLPYRRILNSGSAHLGLTYGLPIVAPEIGCLPETVPAENAFIYDPTRENALRLELERVYRRPNLESIGRANYDHALDKDWRSSARSLVDVYRQAAAT